MPIEMISVFELEDCVFVLAMRLVTIFPVCSGLITEAIACSVALSEDVSFHFERIDQNYMFSSPERDDMVLIWMRKELRTRLPERDSQALEECFNCMDSLVLGYRSMYRGEVSVCEPDRGSESCKTFLNELGDDYSACRALSELPKTVPISPADFPLPDKQDL